MPNTAVRAAAGAQGESGSTERAASAASAKRDCDRSASPSATSAGAASGCASSTRPSCSSAASDAPLSYSAAASMKRADSGSSPPPSAAATASSGVWPRAMSRRVSGSIVPRKTGYSARQRRSSSSAPSRSPVVRLTSARLAIARYVPLPFVAEYVLGASPHSRQRSSSAIAVAWSPIVAAAIACSRRTSVKPGKRRRTSSPRVRASGRCPVTRSARTSRPASDGTKP